MVSFQDTAASSGSRDEVESDMVRNRGFSQAFYRHKLYETELGYKNLEDFLQGHWEKWACSKGILNISVVFSSDVHSLIILPDPENMLVMMQTWQLGDVSQQAPFDGDFKKAMASIKAKTLVLPCKTDLYFPYEALVYFGTKPHKSGD